MPRWGAVAPAIEIPDVGSVMGSYAAVYRWQRIDGNLEPHEARAAFQERPNSVAAVFQALKDSRCPKAFAFSSESSRIDAPAQTSPRPTALMRSVFEQCAAHDRRDCATALTPTSIRLVAF